MARSPRSSMLMAILIGSLTTGPAVGQFVIPGGEVTTLPYGEVRHEVPAELAEEAIDSLVLGPAKLTAPPGDSLTIEEGSRPFCDGPPCKYIVLDGGIDLEFSPPQAITGIRMDYPRRNATYRFVGSNAEGDLLFDEVHAIGRGSRRVLAFAPLEPIVRLRIEPAEPESAPWFLRSVREITPSTLSAFSGPLLESSLLAELPLAKLLLDPLNGGSYFGIDGQGRLLRNLREQGFEPLVMPWQVTKDLIIDPAGSHRLLASTDEGLFRSDDRGESWTPLGIDFEAGAWVNEGEALLARGQELLAANAGATPALLTTFPDRLSELAAPGGDVVIARLEGGQIWRSEDRGRTWAADPLWAGIALTDIIATPCAEIGVDGARTWLRAADLRTATTRYPAIAIDDRLGDLADLVTDGCELLRATPGEELTRFIRIDLAERNIVDDDLVRLAAPPAFGASGSIDGRLFGLDEHARPVRLAERVQPVCVGSRCPYLLAPAQTGFHILSFELPPERKPGLWGVTLRTRPAGGINVGTVLPPGGTQPAFLSFGLAKTEPLRIRVEEFSGRIPELSLEVVRRQGATREVVFGPLAVTPGTSVETPALEPGFYVVAVRSGASDGKGRLGMEVLAQSMQNGVSLGGFIDSSAAGGFLGAQVWGLLDFELLYGEAYASLGAGEPSVQVSVLHADGERVPYSPADTLDVIDARDDAIQLLDENGNQLGTGTTSPVVLSDDGAIVFQADSLFEITSNRFDACCTPLVADPARITALTMAGNEAIYTSAPPTELVFQDIDTGAASVFSGTRVRLPFNVEAHGQSVLLSGRTDPGARTNKTIDVFDRRTSEFLPVVRVDATNQSLRDHFSLGVDGRQVIWVFAPFSGAAELRVFDVDARAITSISLNPPLRRSDTVYEISSISAGRENQVILNLREVEPGTGTLIDAGVYLYDIAADDWRRISVDQGGRSLGVASAGQISRDGNQVAFTVELGGLSDFREGRSISPEPGLFVAALDGAEVRWIARGQRFDAIQVNADATVVTFTSGSALAPFDTNGADDVYVWRRPSSSP